MRVVSLESSFDSAAFARDGFAVVGNAVSPPLLAGLRDALERVQGAVPGLPPELLERLTFERDLPEARRGGIAASEVGDAIFILGDPVAFDPLFWEVLRQPALVSAARMALGVRDLAAHFMNVTIKHRRFGRAIGWHRDYPNGYASPAASCFVRAMLCLDGMFRDGGATAFIPGSHLLADAEVAEPAPPGGWQPPESDVVVVCCDPGDLVLIHPKVLHGGGMNTSSSPRRNIVVQIGDAAMPLRRVPEQETVAGHRLEAV
ncbi:phytanoyl-CoA dioxygenase family protein [Roseomonas populi]|uniref:Phytanoyl-CoA dioxygenase family protein n=1 Tax=Roseomonas populi TaxID=3121582 RepID=A0ABT1X195_9PROT|nr:phytanoyl-CoA dioxygenase family protein [Roseomonas pecuniae]MCR0981880.1 phytanoyl-CoA dioxygenase family protein [Roseomonas pecuniae]